jgi:DNA-binding NtrC family response regulator
VRQLQNAIQYSMIKCKGGTVEPSHFPPELTETSFYTATAPTPHPAPGRAGRKQKLSADMVKQALIRAGGNKAKAARILGVGRATLYNFIKSNPDADSVTV